VDLFNIVILTSATLTIAKRIILSGRKSVIIKVLRNFAFGNLMEKSDELVTFGWSYAKNHI
jgi:hypothetical protein